MVQNQDNARRVIPSLFVCIIIFFYLITADNVLAEITFPDPNLEECVRDEINKPTGELLAIYVRLLSIKELYSRADLNANNSMIDTDYFLDAFSFEYWSSTTNAFDAGGARPEDFHFLSEGGIG